MKIKQKRGRDCSFFLKKQYPYILFNNVMECAKNRESVHRNSVEMRPFTKRKKAVASFFIILSLTPLANKYTLKRQPFNASFA